MCGPNHRRADRPARDQARADAKAEMRRAQQRLGVRLDPEKHVPRSVESTHRQEEPDQQRVAGIGRRPGAARSALVAGEASALTLGRSLGTSRSLG